MKNGKQLEQLVAAIERAWKDYPNASIETNKRLPDRTGGPAREHDLVMTIKHQHHHLIIAFECRQRSRPITQEQVEAFAQKCAHTGVNQGIMVSSSGFCKTARAKARFHRIRCFELNQELSFDWLLSEGITQRHMRITSQHWKVVPLRDLPKGESFDLIGPDGTPVPSGILAANLRDAVQREADLTLAPGNYKQIRKFFPGELQIKWQGGITPVKHFFVHYEFVVEHTLVPFERYSYTDRETVTITAALASIGLANKNAKLMFVNEQGKGGKLLLVPNLSGGK